jgi:integrase
MLRHAWRNEDIPKVPPFPKLSYDPPQVIEYLSMDQQQKILDAIPKRHRPIYQVMMEYGLRPGEARALMWDCIDEDEILIKRAFSENQLVERTKTKKIRRYGLTPYIRDILKGMVRSIDGYLFIRKDGRPYTSKNLNKIWHEACDRVGIKIKLYNAVRHSLGCQLLDEGRELELVRDILGHTRTDMTRRYAKRSSEVITSVLSDRRKVVSITDGRKSLKGDKS